jgi:hypothetical protein
MPTARRNGAHLEHFPVRNSIFELSYVGVRARLEAHISTQSARALKLSIQVRFHRRSLQRDVQNIGMAMNPHSLQGSPRRPRPLCDAGGTLRTGLQAPRTRRARTPGMRRSAGCTGGSGSCRPTRRRSSPAVRSRRAQDTGPERRQGPRKRTARAAR